jgi:anaphase-promoting complex subunit 1
LECKESQHGFIPKCIASARKFFQTAKSEHEFIKSNPLYKSAAHEEAHDVLPRLLHGLHLVYEEQKLNDFKNDRSTTLTGNLGPVLAQLGHWLRFQNWGRESTYYQAEKVGQHHYDFEDSKLSPACTSQPIENSPPSVIEWIEASVASEATIPFLTLGELCDLSTQPPHIWNPQNPESIAKMAKIVDRFTPRTLALLVYFGRLEATDKSDAARVETMFASRITTQMLETLPDAIAATLREAMVACEASPPTTWSNDLLKFVGREDLEVPFQQVNSRSDSHLQAVSFSMDFEGVITDIEFQARVLNHATNNMHSICQSAEEPEPLRASPEADRFAITRLLFSEDQRFIEAARLLEPLKAPVAECIPDPSWSEAEYLEAQKGVMQWVMVRTFALPAGQGMLLYDSKKPLITEKFPLHGFTTVCIMKPMGNHVSADRSNYSEEKDSWAFFHAGVSAGLTISREAEGMGTSWIMFNKPAELHNRHAGLLLALGLNGHLKNIAKWLSFKYLTPKHTMTSIGLLLGLSASYLGTMDPLVTRLLSLHATRMLPVGSAELNLSPLTQTTSLMGIGLLYCNTQHRRMSEVMLSEIEHAEVDDPAVAIPQTDNLRDEGYRLAAGFALGYINLGKGSDLKGLHDMRLLERLLAMAVGPRPIDMVHFLDRATAGAVIAIALIFMKTENRSVANKIDIPDTVPQFDYVRPDIFLLRTLAKHLILWKSIEPTKPWMAKNLPAGYNDLHNMKTIRTLRSDHMPFYNIVAGLLFSVALKYAGSGDLAVRDFLIRYLDQFIRIAHLPALRYDARLTRNTVRNCQDLIALSVATVMAGMGDLEVFRRLRLLHGRIGPDIPYGSHLAAHMALGVLFLGGGSYTLGTSNLAVASLICAFYPLYPSSVLDNKAHLQAFRHFWVLAASPRCLVVRDVYTRRAINLPIILTLKDLSVTEIMAPSLLPALDTIATIQTNSPEYWQVTLDFVRNPAHLTAFSARQTLWVRRRSPSDAHASVFSAALSALNSSQQPIAIFGPTTTAAGFQNFAEGRWDWIFELPTFRRMFHREDWGAALPGDPGSSLALSSDTTAVDARLGLHAAVRRGVENLFLPDMNELSMLLLWLNWAERRLNRGQRLRWIGKDAIVQIRMDIEKALMDREAEAVVD